MSKNIRVVQIGNEKVNLFIPHKEARIKADHLGLQLIQYGDVYKIIDYNKLKSHQKKLKQKKVLKPKEIQIGAMTSDHDLERLRKQAQKFLDKGHEVILRGKLRKGQGILFDRIIKNLSDFIEELSYLKIHSGKNPLIKNIFPKKENK